MGDTSPVPFTRLLKNGHEESICMRCFATVRATGRLTIEEAERDHELFCKPMDYSSWRTELKHTA